MVLDSIYAGDNAIDAVHALVYATNWVPFFNNMATTRSEASKAVAEQAEVQHRRLSLRPRASFHLRRASCIPLGA